MLFNEDGSQAGGADGQGPGVELFSVWTPIGVLQKGRAEAEAAGRGPIGGVLGSEARDQDGEIVLQEGLNWEYFLSKGWFNWEHQKGPENILGEPEHIYPTVDRAGAAATGVEGFLYLERPKAREVYEAAKVIEKASSTRRIGFSVEGFTREKTGATVTRADVLNTAITRHPVNPNATLQILAKSLIAVGYQTPAQPDPSAHLSPLVRQSISGNPMSAARTQGGRLPLAVLAAELRRMFPKLGEAESVIKARDLAECCGALIRV